MDLQKMSHYAISSLLGRFEIELYKMGVLPHELNYCYNKAKKTVDGTNMEDIKQYKSLALSAYTALMAFHLLIVRAFNVTDEEDV